MKSGLSILTNIGILIYVVYSLVDRFIIGIPDIIAIGNLKTPRDSIIK